MNTNSARLVGRYVTTNCFTVTANMCARPWETAPEVCPRLSLFFVGRTTLPGALAQAQARDQQLKDHRIMTAI